MNSSRVASLAIVKPAMAEAVRRTPIRLITVRPVIRTLSVAARPRPAAAGAQKNET